MIAHNQDWVENKKDGYFLTTLQLCPNFSKYDFILPKGILIFFGGEGVLGYPYLKVSNY